MEPADEEPVRVAADLLAVLCELSADREPEPLTVPLAVTPADELDGAEGPVFTHFYLPETGRSVREVFGVDLGTPSGTTPGVFLSHPDGRRELTKRDELREVALVAVPPWEPEAVAAFDRRGRRRPLATVDVAIPEETPP
ncbi:MAG: hypothetical protein U5J98_06495 [Halobacteriales archaeon]|nr:hypothetical protein [Halobacteriales archaeon]